MEDIYFSMVRYQNGKAIEISVDREPECKAELIANLTQVCCQTLGSKPEAVRVILEEMKPENFGKNGKPFQRI